MKNILNNIDKTLEGVIIAYGITGVLAVVANPTVYYCSYLTTAQQPLDSNPLGLFLSSKHASD